MGVVRAVKHREVWSVTLDSPKDSETQKTLASLAASPNEMNKRVRTVLIAPLTSGTCPYTSRETIEFRRKAGQVSVDKLRCVDKIRLVKQLGKAPNETCEDVSDTLVKMFTLYGAPHIGICSSLSCLGVVLVGFVELYRC